MAPPLPDDILHVLCEQLAGLHQFDTLFNCACASRQFAVPALTLLYRAHHLAPVRGGGEDEAVPLATKLLMLQKWSILWKSIIASSLDATLFPYCRYIRALDFRDLENLLEDDQFKVKISKQFFSGPLTQFYKSDTLKRPNGKSFVRLNVMAIVDAIGETVTQHTPTLEVISGNLTSPALIRWIPRLPRLQGLELWDGSALEDPLVSACIHKHCPNFNSLMIYAWFQQDRDHKFAQFISTIRPNSLNAIYNINDIGAAAETFLALNAHSTSLKELRLCVSNDSIPRLSLLGGCTALEALRIEDVHGTITLEETQNDVFLETIDWLRKCEGLKRLSFTRFLSASALVTPLLLEHKILLRSLEIDSYVLKDSRQFHQALAHQKDTLTFLSLSGETDGMFRDDVEIIVDSIKQLTQLRTLRLLLQEVFHEDHLVSVIQNLGLLEELYVSGLELNDRVLESVGNLHNLRSVALAGISKFTIDGLLEFVSHLGPGNEGIRVMVDMADPDTLLPEEQVSLVRESLFEKTGGSFDYTPWRGGLTLFEAVMRIADLTDPNVSEFEGESD